MGTEDEFKVSSFSDLVSSEAVAVRFVTEYLSKGGDLLQVLPGNERIEMVHSWYRDKVICFTLGSWDEFIKGVKNGEFDLKQLALK